jgi:cytochrome c553
MRPRVPWRHSLAAIAVISLASGLSTARVSADMMDMTGVEPQDVCAECHGLDGAGNHIKFPRLAGQKREYIVKQLNDFRAGHRKNDGGQMKKNATELEKEDIPRVADWFSRQGPPWPKPTIEGELDLARARRLAISGTDSAPGCLSCHSATSSYLADRPIVAPRIAGQRDFYIAKQLKDFRDGRRGNDPDGIMRRIALRLDEAEISALAVFLSQNPELHETQP